MAKRSPPLVSQKCDINCTSRMFGILNFREADSDGRLVSNTRHLNKQPNAAGNGKSRISSVDEKYPDVDVSSRRRRGSSCKSICVENDQIADFENEVTKMIVNQRFFNKNYQGKDGEDCQPNQFLDAVQILYSNKELFAKLLRDPNSLLVKQINDLHNSQVKVEGQNGMTRLNKAQNSSARQYTKNDVSSNSNCEAQSSKRIVVLKPVPNNVKKIAETSTDYPQPDSSNSFSYNAQNIKPSHFQFGGIKRKLKHVMRVMRKEQQWKTTDSVPSKTPCGSHDLVDGKNVKELDISERNSPINVHASTEKSLKASFGESCGKNTNNFLGRSLEKNKLTIHDQGVKVASHKKHQMVLRTLLKDGESCSYRSSSAPKVKAPVASFSDELQVLGAKDISVNKSLHSDNFHSHCDIPKDGKYKDSPTQKLNTNDTTGLTGGLGSFQDSHQEIQIMSFSPDIASSSPSSCQRIEETVVKQFTEDDVTNSPMTISHPDFITSTLNPMNKLISSNDIIREVLQDFSLKCDELMKSHLSNLLMDSSTFGELYGLTDQLSGSTILHDCIIEEFMELYRNCGFPPHSSSRNPNIQACVVKKVLVREVNELVSLHFLPHPLPITLHQLVEKDLSRRGSWMNIQVDKEDIAMELEKDVLEKLVFDIVSEIITDAIQCHGIKS